jgi:hypothetical protein
MKFKIDIDTGTKCLSVTDSMGDTLTLKHFEGDKCLYAFANGGVGVKLTRSKALKLAWAIINELDPGDETSF